MAYYAFLDSKNVVTEVIAGNDESTGDWETHYAEIRGQTCKRTSINTYGGVHNGNKEPFRKNYAGIGFIYDPHRDAFIPPKTHPTWIFNETKCIWEPNIPLPSDAVANGGNQRYLWDDITDNWMNIT